MGWYAFATLAAYAHLAEYAIHRWLMHSTMFGRTIHYEEHAVEHHGKKRMDINIAIGHGNALRVYSPMIALMLLFDLWWAVGAVGLALTYSGLWTMLHHAHHDLEFLWIKRIPGYGFWRRHHLKHHDQPNCNFGALFPWTDYLFGTKA